MSNGIPLKPLQPAHSQPGQFPTWAVGEAPGFCDQTMVIGIHQNVSGQQMTVMFVLSFGLGIPPPAGRHVASVAMTPEAAKALHGLLGQHLKNCGMLV
jgi:hypothetical protein